MAGTAQPLKAWFVKAAERVGASRRRYFELRGKEITYYEKEAQGRGVGKKGAIELSAGMKAVAEGKELQLHTQSRTFLLTADDAATCSRWKSAIETEIARMNKTMDNAPLSGWLLKAADGLGQARRRFFLCEGSWVKYFDSDNMAQAKLKGRFQISALSHIENRDKEVLVINPGRTWALTAEDVISAARWASVLKDIQAKEEGLKGSSKQGDSDSGGEGDGANDRFVMPGRGVWMWKEGAGLTGNLRGPRRRYFTLMYGSDVNTMKFAYFTDVVDQRPLGLKGFIPITRVTQFEAEESALLIINPDRTWQLTPEDEDDAARWRRALTEGQKLLPPEPEPEVIDMPAPEPTFIQESSAPIPISAHAAARSISPLTTPDGRASADPDRSLSPEPSIGGLDSKRASAVEVAEGRLSSSAPSHSTFGRLVSALSLSSLVSAFMPSSGAGTGNGVWLVKDAERIGASRRRLFVVEPGLVRYYADAEMRRLKGSIDLTNATVVLQQCAVIIGAAGREWRLTADDEQTAAAWAEDVKAASPNAAGDAAGAVDFSGWLHVGSKTAPLRYAAIKNDLIVRFFKETPHDPLRDPTLSRIPVLRTTLVNVDEALLTLINPEQVLELYFDDAEAAAAWAATLRHARGVAAMLRPAEEIRDDQQHEPIGNVVAPQMNLFYQPEQQHDDSAPVDATDVAVETAAPSPSPTRTARASATTPAPSTGNTAAPTTTAAAKTQSSAGSAPQKKPMASKTKSCCTIA